MVGSQAIWSRPFGATLHRCCREKLGGLLRERAVTGRGPYAACAAVGAFGILVARGVWGVAPNPSRTLSLHPCKGADEKADEVPLTRFGHRGFEHFSGAMRIAALNPAPFTNPISSSAIYGFNRSAVRWSISRRIFWNIRHQLTLIGNACRFFEVNLLRLQSAGVSSSCIKCRTCHKGLSPSPSSSPSPRESPHSVKLPPVEASVQRHMRGTAPAPADSAPDARHRAPQSCAVRRLRRCPEPSERFATALMRLRISSSISAMSSVAFR